ncbi:DUF881 domain-containing protein [Isoptericola sp. b515]|uniref:DUF881 domain-containing protein n=1 Tax=Isoptericola sp. b515 TaxID=3064652 RepID=UPI0027132D24|nr:DUF881 domain-containing protein [Isoptericola sp. b515]MDO8147644.1 DUF881 domain-containing protein [Isoptericola sp. b515]
MSPRIRSGITVAVVLALSGVLFTVSAQLSRGGESRHAEDLSAVVAEESDRVAALSDEVAALDAQIQELSSSVSGDVPRRPAELRAEEGVVSGAWPVEGPGMRVSLEDAPSSSLSIENVTADDLVVHQQDVQHVINALWAGGAEAMTLQGERVTPTSAFRCSGNIMLLHGKVFSPPYVVEAVGDPDRLQAALDSSPGVAIYRDYVDWIDLGYAADPVENIEVPAASGGQDLQFAGVPDGTDVFS